MKKLATAILSFLTIVNLAAAQTEVRRDKNVATRICGMIMVASTATYLGAAPTGLDCEIDPYTDGADPDGFVDLAGAETLIGTTGAFCFPLTAGETNTDYALLRCHATNVGAADWVARWNAKNVTLADGSLTAAKYGPQGTIGTVVANVIQVPTAVAVDDLYDSGYRLYVYNPTTGVVKAQSCIIDSVDDTTDTVTTAVDLSSAITASTDKFDIVPDGTCGNLIGTVAGVTGNVNGNVLGSVDSVVQNVGSSLNTQDVADAVLGARLRSYPTKGTAGKVISQIGELNGIAQ